jgi:hypothetical protein
MRKPSIVGKKNWSRILWTVRQIRLVLKVVDVNLSKKRSKDKDCSAKLGRARDSRQSDEQGEMVAE